MSVQVFDGPHGVKVVYIRARPSLALCRAQRALSKRIREAGMPTRLAIGPAELRAAMQREADYYYCEGA